MLNLNLIETAKQLEAGGILKKEPELEQISESHKILIQLKQRSMLNNLCYLDEWNFAVDPAFASDLETRGDTEHRFISRIYKQPYLYLAINYLDKNYDFYLESDQLGFSHFLGTISENLSNVKVVIELGKIAEKLSVDPTKSWDWQQSTNYK